MTNYRFMRFPNGRFRCFSMSYDGGLGTDVTLMTIMRRFGLKGTFNISSRFSDNPRADLDVEKQPKGRFSLRQIATLYEGFEIASHGSTHPFYAQLPASAALYDVVKDRELLENLLGRIIRGHVYPNGSFTKETESILRAAGFLYARTAVRGKGSFDIPENLLHYDPTAHHNDAALFEMIDRFFAPPTYYCAPRFFCLWGHSHEFLINDNWDRMEEIAKRIGGREDVWYAGMEEFFGYVAAYRALVHSMDSNLIYNPTSTAVWIATAPSDKESVCIAPGETVCLQTNG